MIEQPYSICFVTNLDESHFTMLLTATVEPDSQQGRFRIKNLCHIRSPSRNLLPDMVLENVNGEWVYSDTRRSNRLSFSIGESIEQHEKTIVANKTTSL